MPDSIAVLPHAEWPYQQTLLRLALSLALGLLIGLERERRGKEAGLRTFGFVSLLGAMGGLLGDGFALMILALVGMLAVLLNVQTLRAGQGTELTTSAAMLVTCMAGVLCGLGHTISPAAVMVIATALLAWKERLAGFSTGLTEGEMRSALLLAILAIVIYPALPVGAVGPWKLIEPRAAWVTVILISGIGFVNYILWKVYGARGTELSGFLGGLVNSNFTVIELASRVKASNGAGTASAYRGILLATAAMVARNALLLLILAPLALLGSLAAFVLMGVASAAIVLWSFRRGPGRPEEATEIKLELPFSLPQALKYGLVFLVLHIVGGLTQREFGEVGFYFVSIVGGLMSSASAVAAAATLASQGSLSPAVAGTGAVLASFTSIAFSLSFVMRSGSPELVRRLTVAMACVALAGVVGLLAWGTVQPWVSRWIPQLEERVLR
ncbi:MgtC/SapB family protein [Rhizobacter sp. Root1221]|uniref:MgtC/SapB family protein n=1 Tax=Rhizobacter sp. Root1221 TaxID=1736433 RepID=UPI0006F96149|nr:MgtC/SapB family protein [Rhizobacter sp. Root1221]KQW01285.1 magnesium transporter accessory protein [Rhizobacter sp. Root1221]